MANKRKKSAPREIDCTVERDTREGLNLLRPDEEVTLGPNNRFMVIPGPKGKGWVLKVFTDPPVDEQPQQAAA